VREGSPVPEKVLHYPLRFEWDAAKAASNRRKHGVTFDEARTVFADPLTLIAPDARHADRFHIVGVSSRKRVLFVVYAEKEDDETIRIISARRAAPSERQAYEEGT